MRIIITHEERLTSAGPEHRLVGVPKVGPSVQGQQVGPSVQGQWVPRTLPAAVQVGGQVATCCEAGDSPGLFLGYLARGYRGDTVPDSLRFEWVVWAV